MGGDQNESWVQSKILASSLALSSQACNQRKKLGSPESNKGPELPLLSTQAPATVLSHSQALGNRLLLLLPGHITAIYINLKGVKGPVQAYPASMWGPGWIPKSFKITHLGIRKSPKLSHLG